MSSNLQFILKATTTYKDLIQISLGFLGVYQFISIKAKEHQLLVESTFSQYPWKEVDDLWGVYKKHKSKTKDATDEEHHETTEMIKFAKWFRVQKVNDHEDTNYRRVEHARKTIHGYFMRLQHYWKLKILKFSQLPYPSDGEKLSFCTLHWAIYILNSDNLGNIREPAIYKAIAESIVSQRDFNKVVLFREDVSKELLNVTLSPLHYQNSLTLSERVQFNSSHLSSQSLTHNIYGTPIWHFCL